MSEYLFIPFNAELEDVTERYGTEVTHADAVTQATSQGTDPDEILLVEETRQAKIVCNVSDIPAEPHGRVFSVPKDFIYGLVPEVQGQIS